MNLLPPLDKGLVILVISGWLASCNNDLEILATDYTVYPVVYSVLEVHRDTLAVRLTKTFRGSGSALDYARIGDSVYFPEARVWLEKRNGDLRVARAELIRSDLRAKSPGVFLEKPNWQYIVIRSPETEALFTGSLSALEYHLSVEIPGMPLIFAKTKAYPPAELTAPRLTSTVNFFLDPLQFAWKNSAPFSELYFRMYYSDVYQDTAIARSLNWRDYHSVYPEDAASESVFGQDMMKRIASQVKNDPRVIYRHVTAFQVVIVGIPADLHDYRLMAEIVPSDQIGFPVTNIVNGIGLFTSQTLAAFNLDIDFRSRDSIMFGQYTKHLYFRYY